MEEIDVELTNEELEQLHTLLGTYGAVLDELPLEAPVRSSAPLLRKGRKELPLEHEAASESFLVAELEGRVRLSDETRQREERRLYLRSKKRKPYKWRNGQRKHWKQKEATKRAYNKKLWEKDPLTRLRHTMRQGVDITEEEWQRLIKPVWDRYPAETLRVRHKGGGRLTAYNLLLYHTGRGASPQLVYNGPNELITDIQNPAYVDRAMEVAGNKKPSG